MQCTVITAVPGAGKTTRIVNEVHREIASGVLPKHICVATFSNAAADELRQRIGNRAVYVTTIHSLAGSLIAKAKKKVTGTYIDTLRQAVEVVEKKGMLWDSLFIDEAQDIDNYQRLFLTEVIKHCERAVIVGDPRQSIYEFGSSSPDYMFMLAENAAHEEMSHSYRLPEEIAQFVRSLFGVKIEGEQRPSVIALSEQRPIAATMELLSSAEGSIGLIVRTNTEVREAVQALESRDVVVNYTISGFSPIVALTVSKVLLSEGKPVEWTVLRRLVESVAVTPPRVLSSIDRILKLPPSMVSEDLLRRLATEITSNCTSDARVALRAALRTLDSIDIPKKLKTLEKKVEHVYHEAHDLLMLSGNSADEEVIRACMEYITNHTYPVIRVRNGGRVTVVTAHVSKGSEFDNVVVSLERFNRFEDVNVYYVAVTRARKSLQIYLPPFTPEKNVWNIFDATNNEFGYI